MVVQRIQGAFQNWKPYVKLLYKDMLNYLRDKTIQEAYTLSNFEIRRDVICGSLRASWQVTIKHACFAVISHAHFNMVTRLKHAMTSHIISKLDRVYVGVAE